MPDTSSPRGDGRLRLVLDEHERERSELAHELHEEVAQALAAVLLGLAGLSIGDDSERSESKIASMRALVADTLEHCRALAVALCPPLLDQLGLVPALERLAERAGVEEVSVEPALTAAALGPALETQVYRSVEGALASVRQARGLRVSLGPAYSDVRISVRPFDSDTPTDALRPLEARLDLIGGTLSASEGEVAIRIPAGSAADAGIAAFPQQRHVEIPDGRRRQLP
jgi:signal transduction histidine kinase